MSKLTNITAPQYRCSIGACPGIYRSEDGKKLVIIGERVVSQIRDKAGPGEEAVEISADLVLASLGFAELVEAAKQADKELLRAAGEIDRDLPLILASRALREAVNRINGGA